MIKETHPVLEVENLVFRYKGQSVDTLKGVSFSIGKGQIFGFLGPSGSGKSTTQKVLYKLVKSYQGNVSFKGKALSEWGYDFYDRVGVCFELPNHYLKLTAMENLLFFASFYKTGKERIEELLEKVGLISEADKRVSDFSKGMKVRLTFVRSLLHDPEMLFFDEPTAGLDPINSRKIREIILELKNQGKTIFLTTHNMYDADQLCDQVALLYQGEILIIDSPARLKLKYGEPTVKVTLKNSTIPLKYPLNGLGKNHEFLQLLREEEIQTLHSNEATLEDVFVQITGKRLV